MEDNQVSEKLIREVTKTKILPKLKDKFKNIEIDFQVYQYFTQFYIKKLNRTYVDYTVSVENWIFDKTDERINYIIHCIKSQILDLWCKRIIKE